MTTRYTLSRQPLSSFPFIMLCIVLLASVFPAGHAHAQPGWQWAIHDKQLPQFGAFDVLQTTMDKTGHMLVAGLSAGDSLRFGVTAYRVADSAGNPLTVMKTDTMGNVLWLWRSHNAAVYSTGLVTDTSGNVYVLGAFPNPSIVLGADTLYNPYYDPFILREMAFLVKLSPAGSVLWSRAIMPEKDFIWTNTLAIDAAQNLYVAGEMQADSQTVGAKTLYYKGGTKQNIYIVKYDPAGNPIWAENFGGAGDPLALAVSPEGNIFLSGWFFSDTLTIGSHKLLNPDIPFYSGFLAGFDSAGNYLWAKTLSTIRINYIAASGHNAYLTGQVTGTVSWDGHTLSSTGGYDAVTAKIDASGMVQWVKTGSSPGMDEGTSITLDQCGNLFVAGNMGIGYPMTFGADTLYPAGSDIEPAFFVQYDTLGNYVMSQALSGGGDDVLAINAGNRGSVYITGDYEHPMQLGSYFLDTSGNETFFMGKFRYDSSGCIEYKHFPGTGVVTLPAAGDMLLLPNPTTGSFTIDGNGTTLTHIVITDLTGRQLQDITCHDQSIRLSLAGYAPGMYLVRINGERVMKVLRQ